MAGRYADAGEAAIALWKLGGVKAFYKGAASTILRDVLWNAISFAIFQILARHASQEKQTSGWGRGVASGALAALFTHPLDVIKTRTMTGDGVSASILAQLRGIVDEEGLGVLAKGLAPRLLYLGPLASLILATNELVARKIIDRRLAPVNARAVAPKLGKRA